MDCDQRRRDGGNENIGEKAAAAAAVQGLRHVTYCLCQAVVNCAREMENFFEREGAHGAAGIPYLRVEVDDKVHKLRVRGAEMQRECVTRLLARSKARC